jgi:hypothetical protein
MAEAEAFQTAMETVALFAQACLPPELSTADLEAVLRQTQMASDWQPSTIYGPGQVISPVPANGYIYRCMLGGTSGATPPASWDVNSCSCGAFTLVDGTVSWMLAGVFRGYYDVDEAIYRAWKLKGAKASVLVTTSSAGQSTQAHELSTNCERMARAWQPYHAA